MVVISNKSPLVRYPADGSPCLAEDIPIIYNAVSFTVPAGFCGDSSVPRLFWRVVGAPTTGPNLLAGIIHDYAYYMKLFIREECDEMFYECLLDLSKPKWQAWLMYHAVRMFGESRY